MWQLQTYAPADVMHWLSEWAWELGLDFKTYREAQMFLVPLYIITVELYSLGIRMSFWLKLKLKL